MTIETITSSELVDVYVAQGLPEDVARQKVWDEEHPPAAHAGEQIHTPDQVGAFMDRLMGRG